jgi:hypothetical protein
MVATWVRSFTILAFGVGLLMPADTALAQGPSAKARLALSPQDYHRLVAASTAPVPPPPSQTPGPRRRSVTSKVFGTLVGAAAGFYGGAYLGATIADDCRCDDAAVIQGVVIGAPIGALVGGIIGYKWLF